MKIKWLLLSFLLLACGYFIWNGTHHHEIDIFIPIDIERIPNGLTVARPLIKAVEVRLSGPESTIKTLSGLKLRYPLDLSGAAVGVMPISIEPDRIPLPRGISVVRINPTFLAVRIEKEIKKDLPVTVSVSGEPSPGFLIKNAVANPASIPLKGPESLLGSIEKIFTKPINVSGLTESFKKEIPLELVEGIDVLLPSEIILAEIIIEEAIVTKTFDNITVEGKNTTYRYRISPPVMSIQVKGPVNILKKLHQENAIRAYLDLRDLKPGRHITHAAITLPVQTTLVSVKPEIFTVILTKR